MVDIAFHPLFPLDMGPLHYFSVLGRALFSAQHLEMNCRAIAEFLHMHKRIIEARSQVLDDPGFQKAVNDLWRKTLGQHVHAFIKSGVFSDDGAAIFDTAVRARNEIAHSVAMDVSEPLDSEIYERIDHILELVRSIAAADKIASTIICLLDKDPLPTKDFFVSYEERVAAWVSEGTFEE